MFELWKLQRQRNRVLERVPKIDTTDMGRFAYENEEFWKRRSRDLREIERRVAELATNRLLKEAERFDVPVPSVEPPEQDLEYEHTPEFRSQVRRLIDDEKTRRREAWGWWWTKIILPAFTLVIGLTGAITGLVAVLYKK